MVLRCAYSVAVQRCFLAHYLRSGVGYGFESNKELLLVTKTHVVVVLKYAGVWKQCY